MSNAETVRVTLSPSPCLGILFAVLHGGALIPVWSMNIPAPIASAISAAVLCHACWSLSRVGFLAGDGSVNSVAVDAEHRCAITLRDGRIQNGSVAESTLVAGQLVILAMRAHPWRPLLRVVVTEDMCDRESFRRLRVLLRWAPGAGHDQRRKLSPA